MHVIGGPIYASFSHGVELLPFPVHGMQMTRLYFLCWADEVGDARRVERSHETGQSVRPVPED